MLECAGSAQTWMREAVSGMEERVSRAGLLYERAVFTGEAGPLAEADRELDAAEAIAAHGTGQMEVARQRLEESTRLRREIGLLPGVAANMVGLAYIAAAQQRSDDALALLDEARAIAEASQAHRILQQVSQARAELSDQHTDRPA